MKDLLHDWDDERCARILATGRAAMPSGSRLVLVEGVLERNEVDPIVALVDAQMLTQTEGGRQRSVAELHALLRDAGLEPGAVRRTAGPALDEGLAPLSDGGKGFTGSPSTIGVGMMKIYTRGGDDGTTGLWYGGRVEKSGGRPEAYGSVDEAGAALGLCRAAAKGDPELHDDLLRLQGELFVAGAELATAPEAAGRLEESVSRVSEKMIERLESDIDRYMERVDLPPKFVIPGGTELSARLDLARTAMRRAERRIVSLKLAGDLEDETVLRFVNRASDFLFAAARYADEPDPELFAGRG